VRVKKYAKKNKMIKNRENMQERVFKEPESECLKLSIGEKNINFMVKSVGFVGIPIRILRFVNKSGNLGFPRGVIKKYEC